MHLILCHYTKFITKDIIIIKFIDFLNKWGLVMTAKKSKMEEALEAIKEEAKEECLDKIKNNKCLEQYAEGYKYGYRDGYKNAIGHVNEQIKAQGGSDGDGAKPGWWFWPWK